MFLVILPVTIVTLDCVAASANMICFNLTGRIVFVAALLFINSQKFITLSTPEVERDTAEKWGSGKVKCIIVDIKTVNVLR